MLSQKKTGHFLGFSNTYETYMHHLITVNVRTRTKINIPHINFVKENNQDSASVIFVNNMETFHRKIL